MRRLSPEMDQLDPAGDLIPILFLVVPRTQSRKILPEKIHGCYLDREEARQSVVGAEDHGDLLSVVEVPARGVLGERLIEEFMRKAYDSVTRTVCGAV